MHDLLRDPVAAGEGKAAGAAVRYAWADEGGRLFDRLGAPVIPISSQADLAALRTICELHAARLLEVASPSPAAETALTRTGAVVSLGPHTAPMAALYAHLSGRPHVPLEGVADLAALGDVAVLVATTAELSYELMSRLYHDRPQRGFAPGIIVAAGVPELWRAVKRCAAALFCAGTRAGRRVLMFPAENFHKIDRPEGSFIGGLASNAEIVAALGGDNGLLFLNTHSTGFDLRLGPALQMCPLPAAFAHKTRLQPPCLDSGRCTQFLNLPLRGAAWNDGNLIPPAGLNARMLVLVACSVVRLADDLLDPAFNMAASLMLGAGVGASLATWRGLEAISPEGFELYELINGLTDGGSAGAELERFHGAQDRPAPPVSLCLLGDPEYRIAPGVMARIEARPPTGPARPARGETTETIAGIALARAFIADMRHIGCKKGRDRIDALLDDLGTAHLRPSREDGIERVEAEISSQLIDLLTEYDFVLERLVPYADMTGRTGLVPCPTCQRPARQRRIRFHVGAPDLRALFCDTCATQEIASPDTPSAVRFNRLSDGVLCMTRSQPQSRAAVGFFPAYYPAMMAVPDQSKLFIRWPQGPDGRLLPELPLPGDLPVGPLRCKAFVATSARFEVYTTRMRAP